MASRKGGTPQHQTPGTGPKRGLKYVPRRGVRALQQAPRRARRSDGDDPPPRPNSPAAALRRPVALLDAVGAPRVLVPALRLPSIGQLDMAFFREELPLINRAAGAIAPAALTPTLARRLRADELHRIALEARSIGEEAGTYLLCGLGILASSIVRHFRLAGADERGPEGLTEVPGLEDTLVALGHAHGRVPRDTYEIWTTGFGFTWTGTEGEARFGSAVREAERLLGEAAGLLDNLLEARVLLADSAGRLAEAAALVLSYREVQTAMATGPFPQEFLAMRNFLGAFEVGGEVWEGPNATYALRWNLLELAVGLLGTDFHAEVRRRAAYMPRGDRLRIEAACVRPTLCDLIADTLGIRRGHWHLVSREEIAVRVARLPQAEVDGVRTGARLAQAFAQLSAVHASVIRKNLTDPVSKMTDAERDRQGISGELGVSETPLAVTFQRRDDRMRHPLVEWIAKAREA